MVNHFIPIQEPTRSPRLGGLRTVAEFVDTPRMAMGGELEWTTEGCAFPVDDIAFCYPTAQVQNTKTFDTGVETMQGSIAPFGLYVGVDCFLGGYDYEAQATSLLRQGEDRMIEKRINDFFVSLTGIAVATGGLLEAVAKAEQDADNLYLGRPILWVNRGDAVRLRALKAIESDKGTSSLWTANGTPIVSSSKITANTVGVTGATTIAQSGTEVNRVSVHTLNRERAIAEQVYAVAFDCEFARVYEVS